MSLAAALAQALARSPSAPPLPGDLLDFDGELQVGAGVESGSGGSPAAVLIAVTDCQRPGVIFTVRREGMRTHAGQIAFPGGRIDSGENAVEAALREASEELALDPASVRVIGPTDRYRTITGFDVTPVVGIIPAAPNLVPHASEVADWFEAPLDFIVDPANHILRSALFRGRERHYYEIIWNDRRIWGATAAMIINLSHRLA